MAEDLEIDDQDTAPEQFVDPIAERALAYCKLLSIAGTLKDDDELRKEAISMLSALRKSFKQMPTGDLHSISGGR